MSALGKFCFFLSFDEPNWQIGNVQRTSKWKDTCLFFSMKEFEAVRLHIMQIDIEPRIETSFVAGGLYCAAKFGITHSEHNFGARWVQIPQIIVENLSFC